MTTTYPTKDPNGDDRYYYDQFSEQDSREVADKKRDQGRAAPFGNSTWRVIDEYQGGVIAYTNSEAEADGFVQWLMANPQPVETTEPEPLAEWEQELLNGYAYRAGAAGTGYIIRKRNLDGRFDLGNAFDAIRENTGWKGIVLLSTTYWTNGKETGWWGADEVRWHFQQY